MAKRRNSSQRSRRRTPPLSRQRSRSSAQKHTSQPEKHDKSDKRLRAERPSTRTSSYQSRNRRNGSDARSQPSYWHQWGLRVLIEASVLTLTAAFGIAILIVWYAHDLPNTDKLWKADRGTLPTLIAADGSPLAVRGSHFGAPARLAELPPHLIQAVLAVEDRNFHTHVGVNPLSLLRALIVNTTEGNVRQGGSTITQQLAKNLFLNADRTLKRKVQELLLAFWLERRFTKEEILTLYLNRAYFGSGAYGIDAASFRYFGKPASDLSLNESALVAGLLKAPSKYNPNHNPTDAGLRARLVIESMVDAGFLNQKIAGNALREPIYLEPQANRLAPYFVDHVIAHTKDVADTHNANLIVESTIDPSVQRLAERGLSQALEAGILPSPDQNGRQIETAIVIVDAYGAVRAMIGGRDYQHSQFNRVTQAKRQPGSAFKPFVFLTALEAGLAPWSIVYDGPITIGKWTPDNYKSKFYGEVSLAFALTKSLNTATIRLQEWVGRDHVRELAYAMGFESKLNPDAALALGTDAISPLELAQAYIPFITDGISLNVHSILSIKTAEGNVLFEQGNEARAIAASRSSIAEMNRMLIGVTEQGTGRNARVPGWQVAGKTGTTQDSRDAWFAGHAGGLICIVWTGYDDNQPMSDQHGRAITGGRAPAQIWQKVMAEVLPIHGVRQPTPSQHPVPSTPNMNTPQSVDAGYWTARPSEQFPD